MSSLHVAKVQRHPECGTLPLIWRSVDVVALLIFCMLRLPDTRIQCPTKICALLPAIILHLLPTTKVYLTQLAVIIRRRIILVSQLSNSTKGHSMASFIRIPIVPRCLYCLRHNAFSENAISIAPFWQQVRGKKKVAKAPSTIKVKLLEDIKGYGRSGECLVKDSYSRVTK